MTAEYSHIRDYRDTGMPDPTTHAELFDGLLWRRTVAYLIDICVIGAILVAAWIVFALLTVLSFGVLGPGLWFLFGLIPLAYHTLLVGGRHGATIGMRLLDLELRSWDGYRPGFVQALAHAALFYLTVGATGCLILLFALINKRNRTLHDVLSGMLMVRSRGLALMRA
ncbi:MAG: RDD family protein [Alphaproteobacteria bacterium]